MDQSERRHYLIRYLLDESPRYRRMEIPPAEDEQRDLLRALMNIRPADAVSGEFERVQDAYLQEETARKGVAQLSELTPVQPQLYIWRGDITTLACDAIVNAANSGLTGCYHPLHRCIDNAIHSFAGVQLRRTCQQIMDGQGHEEPTGTAKITPGYNLPCRYVLHTVGPIVYGALTQEHERLLASCYRSCLELAERYKVGSVAFCCISTGEFHFPNERAAEIAVETVKQYLAETESRMKVIFNVFKEADEQIYRKLLG